MAEPRRRASDADDIDFQDEIAETLTRVTDPGQQALLLLVRRGFVQISREIKAMREDIPGLREAVLNGHAGVHHDDHEWIAEMRQVEKERAVYCGWCKEKYQESMENKTSKRNIRDGLLEKIIWAGLSGVAVYLFMAH